MRVIIAEKPSLARAIAAAIPGRHRQLQTCIECATGDVIAWCAGHVLELAPPEDYSATLKPWTFETLPIVPTTWRYRVSAPQLVDAIARLLTKASHVVHAGDPDREGQLLVDELLAPDFVDHRPLPGLPPTRDGVRMLFAGMRAGFPDLQIAIEDQVADERKVVTRKTFTGTHGGPFLGIPATGRKLQLEVIGILELKDGRITDHWVVVDQLSLLTQLGAIQPPG